MARSRSRIVNQEGQDADPPIMTMGRITSNAPAIRPIRRDSELARHCSFFVFYAVGTQSAALSSAAIRAES